MGKTLKNRKKKTGKKTENYKKSNKQDFDKVLGIAENGNKFSTRFREMLKTETRTKTMSSQMSQKDDSRAKTRYRCRPTYWPDPRFRSPYSGGEG